MTITSQKPEDNLAIRPTTSSLTRIQPPILFLKLIVFCCIMRERGSIDEETYKYLTPLTAKPSRFYLLPKIHKPGNPGLPIVASCDAPTEKISEFVDYHLRPLVRNISSDTTDFIHKIQSLAQLPDDSLLVTLDVSSLYINTPHDEGIAACKAALYTRDVQDPPTSDLVLLISEILTKNNFVFGEENFLQVQGTAMGTRMAPSYANMFMAQLEQRILARIHVIPHIWWRYIDDIFAIWNPFVEELNHAHPTIKFTAEWSRASLPFLDTRVSLKDESLTTDLYVKPTDTHQYLAAIHGTVKKPSLSVRPSE